MICSVMMTVSVFIFNRLLGIPAQTAFPYVVPFSLGLVIGFIAPYLYRRRRGEEPVARTTTTSAA